MRHRSETGTYEGMYAKEQLDRKAVLERRHPGKMAAYLARRIVVMTLAALSACLLAGCRNPELEDREFPMLCAVGKDAKSGEISLSFVYRDLEKVSDEMTNIDKPDDHAATAADFYKAWHTYETSQNKVVDYNHVKVLLVNEAFLEDENQLEELLVFLDESNAFPRNTYVCIAEEAEPLLECGKELSGDLGSYIEQTLEHQEALYAKVLPTLGNLFNDRKNCSETLFFPYFVVEGGTRGAEENAAGGSSLEDSGSVTDDGVLEDSESESGGSSEDSERVAGDISETGESVADGGLPVQDGYYCIRRGEPVGRVSTDTAYLSFLSCEKLNELILEVGRSEEKEPAFVRLHHFSTGYRLKEEGKVKIKVSCEGEMVYGDAPENDVISKYVTDYFNRLAKENLSHGIDVSNSYKKLGGYNRTWYQHWKEQLKEDPEKFYEDGLKVVYDVNVVMTTK